MKQTYTTYINGYKDRYNNLFQKYDRVKKRKEELEKEKEEKVKELLKLTVIFTEYKKRRMHIQNMEKQIKEKSEMINLRKEEIEKYSKLCDDKIAGIYDQKKILEAFVQLYKEDVKQCDRKLRQINIMEFTWISRRRMILYELGVILFNERALPLISNLTLLNKVIKDFKKLRRLSGLLDVNLSLTDKEEEISTSLGYTAFLLNCISKYANIPLKFPMQFLGSKSLIMKNLKENLNLYAYRVYDRNKFENALVHFVHNINQILEAFAVNKKYIVLDFKLLLKTLIDLLYQGYVI